jgi:arylsulfatase A-like enzyme
MRKLALLAAASLVAMAVNVSAAARPNIVVILADDMGFSDLGCYGGEIATPNIDRLASEGVKFSQFYNNGRCCPSRASIMTGLYPHQVGVGEMIDNYAKDARDRASSPAYSDHLSKDHATIAELLRRAGYHTMMVGKWHLGRRPDEWPAARGFDRSFVQIEGAMNYFGSASTGPAAPMALDDKPYTPPHDGFFSTDAFGDHAVEFVREAKQQGGDKPFFLYLAFNAPHWPLQVPNETDLKKYKGRYDAGWQPIREERHKRELDLGLVDPKWDMAPMDRGQAKPWLDLTDEHRAEWARRMEVYAAQIQRLDANVGKLLGEIKSLGVEKETIVMFLSDNGGAPEDPNKSKPDTKIGDRDSFRGYARPWATVSNTPLRLHKVTMHEGGISAPLIVKWPEVTGHRDGWIRPVGQIMDVLPTCLEWAGATPPKDVEGKSLVPLLKDQKSVHDDAPLCWEHEGNRAIRQGNWKLVGLAGKPWELYDVAADRCELHDLVAEKPEIAKDLTDKYDAWAKRCGVIPRERLVAAARP